MAAKVTGISTETYEPLAEVSRRLKKDLTDGATGSLRAAASVVALAATWDRRSEEAGGKTFAQWIRATVGPGKELAWWARRADAVQSFGTIAYRMDHEAAVFVHESVDATLWPETLKQVTIEFLKAGSNALSRSTVTRIVNAVSGRKPCRKACAACDTLRAQIVALGRTPEV